MQKGTDYGRQKVQPYQASMHDRSEKFQPIMKNCVYSFFYKRYHIWKVVRLYKFWSIYHKEVAHHIITVDKMTPNTKKKEH